MLAEFIKALYSLILNGVPVLGGSLDGLNAMSSNNYSSGG